MRDVPPPKLHPFTDYFKGFEKVGAVRSVFGDETEEVLARQKVGFLSLKFAYMGINDEDGSIGVGTYHLTNSDLRTLYLDVVHELFHIKQWQRDKEDFGREHRKFMGDWSLYFSSPIEVPAYLHTVREAERLGMTRGEIVEHLKMGRASKGVFEKFLRAMQIKGSPRPKRRTRLPVQINRRAPIALYPFTDYFRGFERSRAVKGLLGARTGPALRRLKVEFVRSTWVQVVPSDEDGHLIVSAPYLRSADSTSVYLDVLASLGLLKHSSPGSPVDFQDGGALIEAYGAMVHEARRLGLADEEVLGHLGNLRFMMGGPGFRRFAQKLGLRPSARAARGA